MPMPKDPTKWELWRQRQSEAQKKNPARYWLGKKQPEKATAQRKAQLMGQRLSPATEFKKGIIPWNKGKTKKEFSQLSNSGVKKGNIPWNKEKHHTEEANRKNREAHMGSKNVCWKGGKSFEPYTTEFNRQLKELIRQRDNYQCQKCGCSERENIQKLCIHHIDYIKENCLPSNLTSLCKSCNIKVNSNREYWTNYFQAKMIIKEMI